MTDLASRLREAKEGSRELDIAICMACFATLRAPMEYVKGDPWLFFDEPFYKQEPPPVTTDLSAAVALCERVLPGKGYRLDFLPPQDPWAQIYDPTTGSLCEPSGRGNTLPLALCLAILTAKEKANDRA